LKQQSLDEQLQDAVSAYAEAKEALENIDP